MKGTLKTRHPFHSQQKTNFDDWSDPKIQTSKRSAKPIRVAEKQDEKGEESDKQIEKSISGISQTTLEINLLRQKIRDGYPLLTQKEIRIFKLPFYESLLLNIREDGFIATYQFLKDLIDMDEVWHKKRIENNGLSKNRLYLKSNVQALNVLCEGLTKAEIAKLEKNRNEELRLFLEMAIYFSNPEQDSWHWLSIELYEQCIAVTEDTDETTIDQELKAIAQYMYASFLLDVFLDPKRAKPLVERSMKLSEGKFWNASKYTGEENDFLYLESCLLLHKIYLVMAHEIKENDVEEAILLCRSSLFWAKQVNNKEAEGTALLNLVIIYIKANQLDLVLGYLENFMSLCVELCDINGICEGYILKAEYHELLGEEDLVINDIKELLTVAEENSILNMIAFAHHRLAMFYLTKGKEKEMLEHAIKSYENYVLLNRDSDVEEARCLTGIAQAHKIMPQYLSLLLDADDIETVEFNLLTLWKSLHIPFFTNVKLFHPEAQVNECLKDKLEVTKNEELNAVSKSRQNELLLTMSLSRIPSKSLKKDSSTASTASTAKTTRKMSKSVHDFQKQMQS